MEGGLLNFMLGLLRLGQVRLFQIRLCQVWLGQVRFPNAPNFQPVHQALPQTAYCSINLQPPNDIYVYLYIYVYIYICRTALLTYRCCILEIYSTNICTEYFKHAAHSQLFPLQNAVYFIMLPFLVPVLLFKYRCAKI